MESMGKKAPLSTWELQRRQIESERAAARAAEKRDAVAARVVEKKKAAAAAALGKTERGKLRKIEKRTVRMLTTAAEWIMLINMGIIPPAWIQQQKRANSSAVFNCIFNCGNVLELKEHFAVAAKNAQWGISGMSLACGECIDRYEASAEREGEEWAALAKLTTWRFSDTMDMTADELEAEINRRLTSVRRKKIDWNTYGRRAKN